MKDKIIFNLKHLPTFFALIFLFLLSIFSFVSYSSSESFSSFARAINETPQSLYEQRMLIGLKDEFAKNNVNRNIKIKNNDGVTFYRVGLNNDKSSYLCEGDVITPIESNLMRYYWTDQIYTNVLIQDIPITYINGQSNFESNDFNIIVSYDFYTKHNKLNEISLYSSKIDDIVIFNVAGYYYGTSTKHKTIPQMFYEVYEEPMFLSTTAFEKVTNYSKDDMNDLQTDIIFSTNYNFNATIGRLFSKNNWKKQLVKYEQFSEIFSKMDQYSSKDKSIFLAIGLTSLLVFLTLIMLLFAFARGYLLSILTISPYFTVSLLFVSLFSFYLISKNLFGGVLFLTSSFGAVVAIVVVIAVTEVAVYLFARSKKRNDSQPEE